MDSNTRRTSDMSDTDPVFGECQPASLSFADVNEFVYDPDQQFENLQSLCLTLAAALGAKSLPWTDPPTWDGERWSHKWPDRFVAQFWDGGFQVLSAPNHPSEFRGVVRILPLTESKS